MTIKEVRFYIGCKDPETQLNLNRKHWGICYWISETLKNYRSDLRGIEVKGIWIVNVHFTESLELTPPGQKIGKDWEILLSTVQTSIIVSPAELLNNEPINNVISMINLAIPRFLNAPIPQLIAIGKDLGSRRLESEKCSIQTWLDRSLNENI